MKRSVIKARRERQKRSTYCVKEKAKRAYRYPPWITDPHSGEHPVPPEIVSQLRTNLLLIFPRLEKQPLENRQPFWLWRGVSR